MIQPTQVIFISGQSGCFNIAMNFSKWRYWKFLSHVEFITTQTDTQIWNYAFIVSPLKISNVNMDKDDNQLKITRQSCNVFVTCYSTSGELLYIKFTHYGMSNLGLYPDGIVPKNFYFQWPSRTEMRCMYKRL